jgi:hypothetical protein
MNQETQELLKIISEVESMKQMIATAQEQIKVHENLLKGLYKTLEYRINLLQQLEAKEAVARATFIKNSGLIEGIILL